MKKFTASAKTLRLVSAALAAVLAAAALCGCAAKSCEHNDYLSDYADASGSGNGFREYTCTECGRTYREVIPGQSEQAGASNSAADETEPDLTRKHSVNLFDLPVYSTEHGYIESVCYSSEETDADGWKHQDCYLLCGSKSERWYRYELSGKYSTVSGKLFDFSNSSGATWLEFYDGEDFLAATPKVDDQNGSVEFQIDISGVEYLTVHLRSSEHGLWMIADDVMLTR